MEKLHNPYAEAFALPWFKGDLHIHSDASDGRDSRARLKARLRECGFDFAAFADHDRYHDTGAGGTPLIIGNAEWRSRNGGDVLGLFAAPAGGGDRSPQALIDAIRDAGGLPVLAHPKIGEFTTGKDHWTYASAALKHQLRGYAGLEIYTHNVGSGFQAAVDRLDAVWTHRVTSGNGPAAVWGLATSDAHEAAKITTGTGIMVAAAACTPTALREALEQGRFYSLAASEARFRDIRVTGETLTVAVEGAALLRLFGVPRKNAPGDNRLLAIAWADRQERLALAYRIRGDEGFIRAEAMDRAGGRLYANPLRVIQGKAEKS